MPPPIGPNGMDGTDDSSRIRPSRRSTTASQASSTSTESGIGSSGTPIATGISTPTSCSCRTRATQGIFGNPSGSNLRPPGTRLHQRDVLESVAPAAAERAAEEPAAAEPAEPGRHGNTGEHDPAPASTRASSSTRRRKSRRGSTTTTACNLENLGDPTFQWGSLHLRGLESGPFGMGLDLLVRLARPSANFNAASDHHAAPDRSGAAGTDHPVPAERELRDLGKSRQHRRHRRRPGRSRQERLAPHAGLGA